GPRRARRANDRWFPGQVRLLDGVGAHGRRSTAPTGLGGANTTSIRQIRFELGEPAPGDRYLVFSNRSTTMSACITRTAHRPFLSALITAGSMEAGSFEKVAYFRSNVVINEKLDPRPRRGPASATPISSFPGHWPTTRSRLSRSS